MNNFVNFVGLVIFRENNLNKGIVICHCNSYLKVVSLSYFYFVFFLVNVDPFSCIGKKICLVVYVLVVFKVSCCFCLQSAILCPYLRQ